MPRDEKFWGADCQFAAVRSSLLAAAIGWTLPVVLAIAIHAAPAEAAAPALHDYLRACGIGADDFARFSDDRQMADEELDVIRRIAVRLRDCPADSLRQMIAQEPAAQLEKLRESQRGRPLRFQGRVESIERAAEMLWRCGIASESRPHHVVVYVGQVANLPESRQIGNLPHTGDRVALDAVFVKFVPGVKDQPLPVFAAPRLQPLAAGPLAELDFDAELLSGVRDNAPLTAADSAAFYRLLLLAKTADADKLRREATALDAAAAARLYADPAGQRGCPFRISGIARSAIRVPIDAPATADRLGVDHYFQINLMADALQDNPLVFCTLELPPNMPLGGSPSYSQPVEATGFFFKTWQYPTGLTAAERAEYPRVSQALQTAPLLVGRMPRWEPASPVKKRYPGWAVGGLLVLAMTGLGLLLWHRRQSDQEFSRHVRQAFQPDSSGTSGSGAV